MADPNAATVFSAVDHSLNDLPEEILTHILSFLSTKSAIQTSLLCRKWRYLWCQLSSLNFPYSSVSTATSIPARSLADFINQTLIRRPSTSPPLQKFHLQFDFKEHLYSSHVDSWVRYAILHHVQQLELDFYISREFQTSDIESDYDFPFFLLKNGNVKILKLTKCRITLPTNVASMGLSFLKSVFLDQVYLSDEMVSNLISGCVNLVFLGLEYCYGMKDVKICSLKITVLHLNYFTCEDGSLEISCPNLVSLEMIGFHVEKYDFKNLSGLVEAGVAFLHMWKYYRHWSQVMRFLLHVKRLTVQNWWFKLLTSTDIFSKISIFCNLKHLELRTEYSKYDLLGIAAILEISPNLETLILDYICKIDNDECLSEELLNKPIHLSLPKLTFVEIRGCEEVERIAFFLALLFDHGVVLEKVILFPPSADASRKVVILQRTGP
ncbi:hypothetical protein JCGZ_13827 [Jatropha curcas]|uniref:F-box domain-containing protein n=1 Tax=Jatropha curcas TaxID=180498 RepID=A0A067KJ11_JATCU|nr:putative F-box/LRR-repeat protein At3g18150 [Jatropha curcas]XP_012078980.1 putative F-box/LRR-repeat protein At3g18150 [Jatropha curcas]KDP32220.1 hypothetical protein JCGZ_13827 [Jatropha curcas]